MDKLKIDLNSETRFQLQGRSVSSFNLQSAIPMMNQSSRISENTTAGWAEKPLYVPKRGEVCIYTDYRSYVDEEGNTVAAPDLKVGDGHVPVVDLPFLGDGLARDIGNTLQEHINDLFHHVSDEDRQRWDTKLNCEIVGDELVLNRM